MNLRNAKYLAVYISISGLMFLYTNCAQITDSGRLESLSDLSAGPIDDSRSANSSISSSAKLVDGSGIQKNIASGCAPANFTDFMENLDWENRRIEPIHCALLQISTPLFSWPVPNDINRAVPMTFILNRTIDNTNTIILTTTPRLVFPNALQSGMYQWQVKYTNTKNIVVVSERRRFAIASGQLLALPTGAAFSSTIAIKSHPRALPAGSDFATIAMRAQAGEYGPSYNAFLNQANKVLSTTISAVPANLTRANFTSDGAYDTWLLSLRNQSRDESSAIETLAYATKLTGNMQFESAGIARLLAFAKWPTNGATSEAVQDQANREIYLALSSGLDLFYSKLKPAERVAIVAALKDRLNQVMAKFPGLDRYPYDSHLLTATLYATEALMYVAGMPEFPEAKALLASSWETMITTLSPWGSSIDGGFANGGAYGWYAMTAMARMVAAVKLIGNLNLTPWPTVGRFVDNQIAFTPAAGRIRGQFGDDLEITSHYFDYAYDSIRLLASVSRNPELEWYWRSYPKNVLWAVPLSPFHYLMLGTLSTAPSGPTVVPTFPNSYLFEDAGVVAMHSKTTDTLRSSVFFRSSRFGSFNHSHADNNSFTFVSKGYEMLISGGFYPYYNSPHHAKDGRATRYKNAMTFDGGIGQAEPVANPAKPGAPVFTMQARGKLINYVDNGVWAVTTGDASLAYRGRDPVTYLWSPLLSSAIRTVAYNRNEGVVVVYDWAVSGKARKWELNFQSVNNPTLSGSAVKIVNGPASVCLDIHGPAGTTVFTKGFDVPPEAARPEQYHTRYTVNNAANELVAVTILRESCRDVPVAVQFIGSHVSVSVNGSAPLVADGKTVSIP